MPLMGKESRGSRQHTPAIVGGSGVVDVADGSQGADQRHDPQNHRGGRGDESRRDVGRIHERVSVGDGRHVDKSEIPQDKNLEVDVPESHDNGDRRMICGGVSDPKMKTECSNQLLDKEGLFAKATKDFTAQQRRQVGRRRSGGESEQQRRGMKRREGGGEGFSFYFGIIALRTRGRKQGQCRPRLRGRHLHGSMVRAQKPADERVSLTRD